MITQNNYCAEPCLIITYKRSANCMSLIDSLLSQGCRRMYVAIDFGNTNDVIASQSEFSFLEVKYRDKFEVFQVWRRGENLGVAVSVITAIDWFFKNEERGVILEDDLIISTDFLKFMSFGLQELEANKNVFSISASNFFSDEKFENFFSTYFIGWGWGTWRDRWNNAKMNFLSDTLPPPFTFNEFYNFWSVGAYRCKVGIVDTWDLELTKFIRDNKFVNVIAARNLVSNIGFDQYSTNTKISAFPLGIPIEELALECYKFMNLEVDSNFDRKLEKQVFRIRFRHKFLFFVYRQWHLTAAFKNPPLVKRLQKVLIP
jgi:hypothetical protein